MSRKKIFLGLALVAILSTILFETSQQLFYIRRYNLAQDITFWDTFSTQAYRWMIWLLLAIPLILYCRKKSTIKDFSMAHLVQYGLVIGGLLALNILFISLISFFGYSAKEPTASISLLFTEFLPFFTYQKVLIYSLGYFSLVGIMHYYYINEQLNVKVEELGEVKKNNGILYEKLRYRIADKAPVLNIRIGNKQKIIPVENIVRVEANDYCVNVVTKNHRSYAMRISLKLLEEKLPSNFLRVHRKTIVNMSLVQEVQSNGSNYLLLNDQTEIPIAKSRLKAVNQYFVISLNKL